MKFHYGKTVLITGASSGIGRATARLFMEQGFHVYGTTRNLSALPAQEQLIELGEGFIEMLKLDVTMPETIKPGIDYIVAKEGELSILVNNAGHGLAGPIEETSPDEARHQVEVNFFGVVNMLNHVLPVMREQGKGLIINISSMAGFIPLPFQAFYTASKFAVEGLTRALKGEVKPLGIKVCLVEPGDTATGFTGSRVVAQTMKETSPYHGPFSRSLQRMINDEENGPSPELVARSVLYCATRKHPPVSIVPGIANKVLHILWRVLPQGAALRIIEFLYAR